MPHFAANLSMLWPELDVYDRFRAAAEAGFSRVEILFVHALDRERIARLLKDHALELVLFDPYPGNWEAGERGLLSLPGREDEFALSIIAALEAAKLFGTRRLNAIAGVLPPGVNRAAAEKTAIDNLRRAAPLARSPRGQEVAGAAARPAPSSCSRQRTESEPEPKPAGEKTAQA